MTSTTRRDFLQQLSILSAGLAISPGAFSNVNAKTEYKLSLAQWSLHRMLRAGKLDNLDFPAFAKKEFGIGIVEYVNQFFPDKAKDTRYLTELKKRCNDNGIRNHLIMVDSEGELGAADKTARNKAVENHYKWVDAAKFLGCITIRVNAHG